MSLEATDNVDVSVSVDDDSVSDVSNSESFENDGDNGDEEEQEGDVVGDSNNTPFCDSNGIFSGGGGDLSV